MAKQKRTPTKPAYKPDAVKAVKRTQEQLVDDSTGKAVVLACRTEITEEDAYHYAALIMCPPALREKASKAMMKKGTTATLKYAALGFAFDQYLRACK